jgi:hypothetical protein
MKRFTAICLTTLALVIVLSVTDAFGRTMTRAEQKAAGALTHKAKGLWPDYTFPNRTRNCREFHYSHPHPQPKWEHAFFCHVGGYKDTDEEDHAAGLYGRCYHFIGGVNMLTKHNRPGYRYYDAMTGKLLDWNKYRQQKPFGDGPGECGNPQDRK